MKARLLIPMAALLMTVSASAMADGDPLDAGSSGAKSSNDALPGGNAAPPVPGRSYRDQAPPRYRIEAGNGGRSNAFPRVPGTSYRDYSRPSYTPR